MMSSEFHDYFENKLSKRERNAFEKKMQKDLFNMDAAEGYAMVTREEAEEDLSNAGKKIRQRINLRRRIGWYSAAATFAAILTITTIFLAVDQDPDSEEKRIRKMNKSLENTYVEKKNRNEADEQTVTMDDEQVVAMDKKQDPAEKSSQLAGKEDVKTAEVPPSPGEDAGVVSEVIVIMTEDDNMNAVIDGNIAEETILAEEDVSELFMADVADEKIAEADTKDLTKIKGLGKIKAEKMIKEAAQLLKG